MAQFLTPDFLLLNKTSRRLYDDYACTQPVMDFHCHLSPKDIALDRRFTNLSEIWLEDDLYKWRAMRANGVEERYCTGDAPPYDKFLAWARTVPSSLRNPLYHWTHLELQRYFGIRDLLNEKTAPTIWSEAGEHLASEGFTARGILKKFGVRVVCTTDDPADSLEFHRSIAVSGCGTRVFPSFRPDAVLRTGDLARFNEYVEKLGASANISIVHLRDLLSSLKSRHDYFHQQGCRLSDHGLNCCYADFPSDSEANVIFDKARANQSLSAAESGKFASYMMLFFGHLDAEKGWTKQLHLGAFRNVNPNAMRLLGVDTGFDSIGDWQQAIPLASYLGRLCIENALPRMIIYNLNPADNYLFASMAGNFQNGTAAGTVQVGSGWWFLDQREGIEWQLNSLSNVGLLSRFVGMVTDSRSFMSYPRHEYFRRILCNLLGQEMENGLLPQDEELIGEMIQNICYRNAAEFLCLPGVS